VAVVLPERPDEADLRAGLQTMAALGRWSVEDLLALPRLVRADTLRPEERGRLSLLLIGGPNRNSVTAAAGKADAGLLGPVAPAAHRLSPAEQRSPLRLVASPWAADRALLLFLTDDPGGLNLAAAALARDDLLGRMRGRTAVIVGPWPLGEATPAEGPRGGRIPPQTLTDSAPPSRAPASLAPRVEAPAPEAPRPPTGRLAGDLRAALPWAAAILAVLLAIIAVALGLRRARGR
jgi:hypothetical protein